MYIAYMIQAHKNAEQINRLINALNNEGVDFYLHIDKKSKITDDIDHKKNVFFVENRVDVRWGQISQVEASLSIMYMVKNSGKAYDYVWLISGQDFPIKTNREIVKYLEDNKGNNFVSLNSRDDHEYRRFVKRNELWYPLWLIRPKFVLRAIKKVYITLTGGAYKTFVKRKNILCVEWMFGSSWFTITYDAMQYILSEIEKKPYMQYYKHSVCPDESIIQTILYNSDYRATLKDNLAYIDWTGCNRNPKLLGDEDVETLLKSDKLIARKFDIAPTKLVDALNKSNNGDDNE